jgi:hypothetical protein
LGVSSLVTVTFGSFTSTSTSASPPK